jgi:DNA-binding transcriptional regulator LsrR (DeoR family)
MAGRKPRAAWTDAETLKVLELYYHHEMKQSDIGRLFHRTRQDVGRVIEDAKRQGLVKTIIAAPMGSQDLLTLEQKLIKHYDCLEEVVLIPGHPTLLDEHPIESITEGIALSIARAGARLVAQVITGDDTVVVGRGHMVKELVNSLEVTHALPGLQIVPMQGVIRRQHDPLDANVIAADLQRVTGGTYSWLPIPAIVKAEQRETVRSLPIVSDTLKLMQRATIVITSLGPINEEKLSIFRDLGFPRRDMHRLAKTLGEHKLAGEIGGWLYRTDGSPVRGPALNWYPIGFELDGMCNIVERKRGRVICVVGADRKRFNAIHAALCGSMINTLITDHITAQYLLEGAKSQQDS